MIKRYLFVSKFAQEKLMNEPRRDEMFIFLSTILTFTRMRRNLESDDFASVNSLYLQLLFGNRYKQTIIEPLKRHGIIECDNRFILGEKCHGYRLIPPYNTNLSVPVISNRKLITKLQTLHDQKQDHKLKFNKFIIKNQRRLEMDTRAAFVDFVANCNNEKFTKNGKQDALLDIYHFCLPKNERDFNSVIGHSNGRNYTLFTGLNSNLRGYLSVNGEKLCLLDLKNSQPFFAIKLYYDFIKPTAAAKKERERYVNDVTSADPENCFYRIIHGAPFESKEKRAEFKRKTLAAMYDDPSHGDTNPVWQKLKARYPILAAEMERIKSDAPDFNVLALLLQS